MNFLLSAFASACRYEFLMQIRRVTVWILILVTGLLLGGLYLFPSSTDPAYVVAAERTQVFTLFFPITLGILLADRWSRDSSLHTGELLSATPTGPGPRLWGKYLGTVFATAIPTLCVYLLEFLFIAIIRGDAGVLLLELRAFALEVLPSLLFVGAFCIACTQVLPPIVFTVLFVGYWFWANVVPPARIPTINCSLLTANGLYARVGLLGGGITPPCRPLDISATLAWENIGLLLGLAVLAMLIAQIYASWRAAR